MDDWGYVSLLIEREEQIRAFAGHLDRLARGTGNTVVVSGPVATGRTRLLRSFLSDVAERGVPGGDLEGVLVLTATGTPATSGLPFEMLTPLLAALPLPSDLCREVEACTASVMAGGGLRPEDASLAHRVAEAVLALTTDQPVVLAVDDAQDGDELSLRCLAHLARRLVAARMLLAVAVRTGTGYRGPVHAALLHEGFGSGYRLAPLSERGVAALVADRLGRMGVDRTAAECFALTGGNCLLVNAVLEDLVAQSGGLPPQRGARLVVGEAYGRAVLACLDRAGEVSRRTAEVLAVVGDWPAAVIAEKLGVHERSVLDAVAALETVGVLSNRDFRHPVARGAVLAGLTETELAELHLWAAGQLQHCDGSIEEIVDHFLAAGRVRDQSSISLLQCVAERALIVDDVDRAVRCLRLAAAHCSDDRQRAAVIGRLASVVWRSSTVTVAQRHLCVLIQALHDGTLPTAQLPAVLRYLLWHGRIEEAGDVVSGLSADGSDAECVESMQWWLRHTYPAVAARIPARPARTGAHDATPGTAGANREMAARVVGAVLEGGDPGEVIVAAQHVLQSCALDEDTIDIVVTALLSLTYVDRLDLAQMWCDDLAACAHQRRAPTWAAVLTAVRADIALREGDLPGAVGFARSALELMPVPGWGITIGFVRAVLVAAHTHMEEYEEAAEELRQPVPEGMYESRFGLHYLFARGQYYQAVDRPYAALTDFCACGALLSNWNMDVPGIVAWRSAAAQCYLTLGQRDKARELAEEQLALSAVPSSRPAGMALRVLAATVPAAQGIALLEQAVSAFTLSGARMHLARALLDLGGAHHELGEDTKARMTLREARRIAKECQARGLERGLPFPRQAEEQPPRSWPRHNEELSEAERRVATLAAEGHTNRQIADKLYVTVSTVEQHLTRTYRKLGISRRSDIGTALNLRMVRAV